MPDPLAELDAILHRLNALANAESRAAVRLAYRAAATRVIEAMEALAEAERAPVEPARRRRRR